MRNEPRALGAAVPAPTGDPLARLTAALDILARPSSRGGHGAPKRAAGKRADRRADELVAYVNELYVRLQRRMEVPAEIWLLNGGRGRCAATGPVTDVLDDHPGVPPDVA